MYYLIVLILNRRHCPDNFNCTVHGLLRKRVCVLLFFLGNWQGGLLADSSTALFLNLHPVSGRSPCDKSSWFPPNRRQGRDIVFTSFI